MLPSIAVSTKKDLDWVFAVGIIIFQVVEVPINNLVRFKMPIVSERDIDLLSEEHVHAEENNENVQIDPRVVLENLLQGYKTLAPHFKADEKKTIGNKAISVRINLWETTITSSIVQEELTPRSVTVVVAISPFVDFQVVVLVEAVAKAL